MSVVGCSRTGLGICPRSVQSWACPLSRTPYIIRNFIYISARTANPHDEIREPRKGKRGRIYSLPYHCRSCRCAYIKAKNGASLGKDYAIPANAKLPRVLHTRLTRLFISHFSRITQHYEIQWLLMSFRPQIDFFPFSLISHSSFIFFIVLILSMISLERTKYRSYPRQIGMFQLPINHFY